LRYVIIKPVISLIDFDLYIQTGYSFNGSLIGIDALVENAKKQGFRTLGIADRGRLYGALKFHQACKNAGIKPVIGMYVEATAEIFRDLPLLLLAKNDIGYRNLVKISSQLSNDKDHVQLGNLKENSNGVICVIMADAGEVHRAVAGGDFSFANQIIRLIEENCRELYLGLDLNDFETETQVASELVNLYKTVIMNKVLYMSKEDIVASRVLKAILKESSLEESDLLTEAEAVYDFKSPARLDKMYGDYRKSINNTNIMISEINLEFEYGHLYLPKYPVPDGHKAAKYLRALAEKGLEKRLESKKTKTKNKDIYRERLAHELKIIEGMGYEDYFLIVWDIVLYAKKAGILVGPGRGSSAGSLVAYVLGIVDVDPLDFDLYFERFLNPERITMPDIDLDFPDDKRDEVIRYVSEKYGKDHVSNIVAFGTFQGKSALREAGRVLGTKPVIIDEVTKYISETDNSIVTFKHDNSEKYDYLMKTPEIKMLFDIAEKIADLPKHISTHAAGIIISEAPITDHVPVQPGLLDLYQTQYEAIDLEKLGLLKIDFLGIRNLTIIRRVLEAVKENIGKTIDIYKLPLDDVKTFALLREVRTIGIFQLESRGMMNLLGKMNIHEFEDISTCIALFRPGPMENIPSYLRRLNNQEKIDYIDPELEPILKSTKGIIVYQEQIMQIAHVYAGYSLGEADVLRRAVSKKKEETLVAERTKFLDKCRRMNRDETVSNRIYDYIVKFANYGFNKSHSVAYSLVAYWMAYLKANYPGYFMSVLMDSAAGSQGATLEYIQECRKLGIKILPPRINKSRKYYQMEKEGMRYPYLGIRNIGSVVADRLDQLQEEGEYKSFADFVIRAKDINVRVIESMIMAGVFDDFGLTKQTMMMNLKQIMMLGSMNQSLENLGFVYVEYPEYDRDYLASMEKELIGFNLSFHPLAKYRDGFRREGISLLSEATLREKQETTFAALLRKIKVITTKNQEEMAFLEFEDMFVSLEAILFPRDYRNYKNTLEKGGIYIVRGKIELRNNVQQMVIESMKPIKEE